MTAFNALEILKNRITTLSLNHKIGSRDIAKQEVKEIVIGIKTHVIPTLDKALERAKKVEELLEVYRSKDMHMEDYYTYGSLRGSQKALDNLRSVKEEIEVLEKELEEIKSEK